MSPRLGASYVRVLANRYSMAGVVISFTYRKTTHSLTVIDLTKGIEVDENGLAIPTIFPSVSARISDLNALGVKPPDLIGVTFPLNGKNWRVKTTKPKPGPFGDDSSESYLVLIEI